MTPRSTRSPKRSTSRSAAPANTSRRSPSTASSGRPTSRAPDGHRGRPQLSYAATDLADALFPKAYGALTNELLGYLDDEDATTVDRLFARRRDTRIANARVRLAPKRTLKAKVTELATILDEDGYIATAETIGPNRYRIVEHNCAIAAVARRYGQACISELEFIRTVLPNAVVERTQHMVAGDRHCAYEIRPPSRESLMRRR